MWTSCMTTPRPRPVSGTTWRRYCSPIETSSSWRRAALHYLEADTEEKDWLAAIPLMHEGLSEHCTRCNHCLPCPVGIDTGQRSLYVGLSQ